MQPRTPLDALIDRSIKCARCGATLAQGCDCAKHYKALDAFYDRFNCDGAGMMSDDQWAAWLETVPDDEFNAACEAHGSASKRGSPCP